MAKDPAFLFYASDFISGVSDLTMEERGQYITLLCLQHQKGIVSEKTIRLNLGSVSVEVLAKFTKDESGNYYNNRLREEIEKRAVFTESRRNNGVKGGRPKASAKPNGYPNDKPKNNHIEDENENKDESELENEKYLIPEILQNWYETFPTYTKSKSDDFPAVMRVIAFMMQQHGIGNMNDPDAKEKILGTFAAISDAVKNDNFWINKPLKSIANNIQEFYNKIKNPQKNGAKKQSGGNLRAEVQNEFDKRYGNKQPA